MKVNDPNINGAVSSGVGRSQQVENTGRTRAAGVYGSDAGSDRVELSNLSASLRAEDAESPERAAYVAKLKAEYDSGNYNPDSLEVSKRIVADAIQDRIGD